MNNLPTIEQRHEVPATDRDKNFIELAYFLHSKIDETEEITPLTVQGWLQEHKDYCAERRTDFCYKAIGARPVKI